MAGYIGILVNVLGILLTVNSVYLLEGERIFRNKPIEELTQKTAYEDVSLKEKISRVLMPGMYIGMDNARKSRLQA